MIALTLAEVASATGGRVIGDPATMVAAVTTDSRRVPERALFVALPGDHADGHDFAPRAGEAGARGLLVARELTSALPQVVVDDPAVALLALAAEVRARVGVAAVAITGSVGKTTVKDLTAAAVGSQRRTVAARGSFNNELGVPLTLLELAEDTEVLVAELGARHVGDIAALAGAVAPDIAVVTAVAGVHLEVFGTIEAVAAAKGELVEALGPGGMAVLNTDDPRVAALADRAPAALRVGVDDPSAHVRAHEVWLDETARAHARLTTPWGQVAVRLPVAGRHHVINAALAVATAGHLGVELAAAAAALATATISGGRAAVRDAGDVVVLDDAYNANPTSVAAALDTLELLGRRAPGGDLGGSAPGGNLGGGGPGRDPAAHGRRWAVLGVMAEIGAETELEHERIGERVVRAGVDELIVVGAGADGFARGARRAGLARERVHAVADAHDALAILVDDLAAGDAVLVKGSRLAGLELVSEGLVAWGRDAAGEGAR